MGEAKEKWSLREWVQPLLNRNFLLILLIQTVHSITSKMINAPISPRAKAIGISSFVIGMCTSVYTATTICARPFAGFGMDKLSKRNIIIGAFVLKALVSVLYAFTGNVVMFALSRAIHGFVFALLGSALPAAITAAVDKKSMGTALGIFLVFPSLVNAWGTKIVRWLYTTYSFRAAYIVIAAMMVIPIFLTFFVKFDEGKELKIKKKRSFNIFQGISVKALPLCVLSFFMMIGYYANNVYRLVFMEERGVDVASALVISGSLSVITRLLGGFIADRWGAKWVVAPSFGMCALAQFMLAGCTTYPVCVVSCILWALGIGMYLPALQSQVFNSIPSTERGAASATWFMCMDLTGLICTPILGIICDKAGYSVCFNFAGVCVALGLVYYMTVGQKIMKKAVERNAADMAEAK